jgi:hypothetical protein
MRSWWSRWVAAAWLLVPLAAAQAEGGWSYQYKWIDVTAERSSQEATELAHDLHRLDAAMVKMLALDLGDSRPRVHLYSMSESQLKKLLGDRKIGSEYVASGFENDILINDEAPSENRYYGAYYGYAGSVLMSEGALRYPFWFRTGVAEIFSASKMERKRVKLGGYLQWRAHVLLTGTAIPVRTLLRLHQNDPQVKLTSPTRDMYDSECWFLVHLILIEGKYREQFGHYLELMNQGQTEPDAFAASFQGVSYEDLDKMLKTAIAARKISELYLEIPEEQEAGKADRVSAAELKGRFARVGVLHGEALDYSLKFAQEALAAEPTNESALRALALGQVRQERYDDAFKTSNQLAESHSLSAPAYADCAAILVDVARAVMQGEVSVGEEAPALVRRAREDYEHAIALDEENLGYWSQLTELIGAQHDVEAAKALKSKAEKEFYLHPRNSNLARALASMYGQTNDPEDAFKFAVAWQKNAIDDAGRDAAAAYISRLRIGLARRDAASVTATPAANSDH